MPEEPRTIVLPKDDARKTQLRRKLEEYRKRVEPFHAPEQMMDTICKVAVLEQLLRDSQVNTWDLSRELFVTYGRAFDPDAFNNACGTIEDYCKTGGQNASGGTGLR
jgi:hypothetical protein